MAIMINNVVYMYICPKRSTFKCDKIRDDSQFGTTPKIISQAALTTGHAQ